jgi:acyl-CoA reductase-like NAD-dependent aldehyde dehydrogenase
MQLDEPKLQEIVEKVIAALKQPAPPGGKAGGAAQPAAQPRSGPAVVIPRTGKYGVFPDVDSAVEAARRAYEQLQAQPLALRAKIIEAIREVTRRNTVELSQKTVDETKMGRVEDKINKNLLAANKTPGVDSLQPTAWSGDDGLTLMERAPYGVIGSITPCTNATETIICNAIGMIAAGNSVVFNTHPTAKNISNELIRMLNQALLSVGGPENLLCVVADPTIASANQLMEHPGIALLVVTGGPGVVDVAMSKKKKVIAAGPGNPPAVVDETANLERAGRSLVLGASLDNNIVCVVEKEILAVKSIADKLKQALAANSAFILREAMISRVEKLVVEKGGTNKAYVGKDASYILKHAGIDVTGDPRLIVCEVDEKHPFVQHELLMPILPLVRVSSADEGIDMAVRVEHGFRHTAVIHSTNIENMHRMARVMNCSIFVKNAPSYAGLGMGGEGYASFTIASPTGEGLTYARHFSRERRCVLKDYFRIV